MKVIGQLYAPSTSLRQKNPRYPLNRRLDGPKIRYGHIGKEENHLFLPEFEPRFPRLSNR
jgi:hypothetical protein